MDNPGILTILFTLVFSAFFSGMEIAFISANKFKIELDNKKGGYSAKILSFFLKNQSKFIATMLVGNNIALVIYGVAMTIILEPWVKLLFDSEMLVLSIQTFIATIIIIVVAEFTPKSLFRINPNRSLTLFSIPVYIIYYLLYPIVAVIIWLAEGFLSIFFKIKTIDTKIDFTRGDLYYFVKEATSSKSDEDNVNREIQIFQNALDFSSVKARECMVPRTDIVAMDVKSSISSLKEKFIETGLSKILIYKETMDNIIGYTHSYELFHHPKTIKSILMPISIVPESMPANEILERLINQHRSAVVVVDEFGGTAGMVTVEDVIEEIFGEIEDEHDKEETIEHRIDDNNFDFSGRLEVNYLNEKYYLNLPEKDEYKTLGGLIIHINEDIPELKEIINYHQFQFEITGVAENRIERVHLCVLPS